MGKFPKWLEKLPRTLARLLPSGGAEPDALRERLHGALLGRDGLLADNAALGILIAAGLEVGQAIYSRPGLQASLDALLRQMRGEEPEMQAEQASIERRADAVVALLRRLRVEPRRLAVDGVPGSGKSSLARALAARLGMQWRNLDHADIDRPLALDEPATIYEHHRLLRTQDIDRFDALIYLDEPVERSKQKVLGRKRGGILVDVMDFARLKRVGEKAFAAADGEAFTVDDGPIRIKLRPPGGFHALENIQRELRGQGIDPAGLSKEQCLFLASERSAGQGFLAYLDAGAYNRELLLGLAAALYHIGKYLER